MFFLGDSALLTSYRLGFQIAAGGPAAFDVRTRIWDNIDAVATTTAQFNTQVADFTLSFTGQTAGAFISNPVSLATLPGGGVTVTSSAFSGAGLIDAYVQLDFLQPGTLTPVLNNSVTYIFDGTGVNTGFSLGSAELGGTQADDVYWRDANGNGIITANEGRNFTAPDRANFVMEFSGVVAASAVVPETNTLALLAFGVAPVIGMVIPRRRKAA